MAVDSRDKRASVIGLGLAALLVLPEPGTIDQPDRQHVAYSYRGIEAGEAVVVAPETIDITGTHAPTVSVTGTYSPTISLSGAYTPTIEVTGA